jgi:hypothetical protein
MLPAGLTLGSINQRMDVDALSVVEINLRCSVATFDIQFLAEKSLDLVSKTGLPDFSLSKHTKMGKIYQRTTKYTKRTYVCTLYQFALKCAKWSQNIQTVSSQRPSKIYPNRDFWFENKPSGKPGRKPQKTSVTLWAISIPEIQVNTITNSFAVELLNEGCLPKGNSYVTGFVFRNQ